VTPLVSILIPCHDAARWLPATLASALGQTWPRCDVVVVDDGSTDDSLAIARRHESRGVIVVSQPNRGAAAARNAALRPARGEFVQFLDADDLLAPDKIARQMAALAAEPENTIASGPWGVFADAPEHAAFHPEPVWADHAPVDWLVRSWSGGGMFPPLVWLTPRALVDAAGPWNEALSLDDDGEYFARVLLRSSAVRFVADATSYYRAHRGPRVSALRGRRAALSSFTSIGLKERHLLAAEDSPRTRQALACHWQRFVWEQLATAPDLAAHALERVRALAPGLPPPGGSRAYRLAARVLGWHLARRLQLGTQRLLRR
jgi:glycosyltransferase involved in cell wall biosynthesis